MIKFVFDNKNNHGFIPNLVKDLTIEPNTDQWWDLALKPPFSCEFRLIKYLYLDAVPHIQKLVSELHPDDIGQYPVNLNFFDPEIDYFSFMEPESLERLKQGKLVFVFYYSEGDWLDLEIIPALDRLCHKHGIDINNIRFVTANGTASDYGKPFIYFPDDELYYRYLHLREKDYVQSVNLEARSKKFTCLNRVDKIWRRMFAASLWQHGLTKQGYFSYTNQHYDTSHQSDMEKNSPMLWDTYWNNTNTLLAQFEINTPIICDDLSDQDHNNHKLIQKQFYDDAYWNFVVETHFDNHTIFLTEKTFKPILNLQPFVIIGNPGSLGLLKKLGYKTFGNMLDEGYDEIHSNEKRLHRCFTECYKLASHSDELHRAAQQELGSTLRYNQNHFLSSKASRLIQLLQDLE